MTYEFLRCLLIWNMTCLLTKLDKYALKHQLMLQIKSFKRTIADRDSAKKLNEIHRQANFSVASLLIKMSILENLPDQSSL